MIVSFFEEFPTSDNMDKYKLVKWRCNLYLGCRSLDEFEKLKKKFPHVYYWPLLSKKEGYWLSPFTSRKALLKVVKYKGKILWDAELPTKWNPWLFFTFNFSRNKKLIYNYFKKNGSSIVTAEYFPEDGLLKHLMDFLGLSFDPGRFKNSVCKMMYTSMHEYPLSFIRKELKTGVKLYGSRFKVGLGVIAKGVDNEGLLSVKQLDRDLRLCLEAGVKEVIIFRLGGLNSKYFKVIKKYV